MVAQTRTAGQPSPRKLKFHEKLVGKGLASDVLLKKVKALHTELADLDQEFVDVNSLSTIRKDLINTTILLHKDKGVKAYAACCIADLLRLYAPDAPYTHTELTDIFQFFIRQLVQNLKSTDTPYYNQYFHLLESLSTVKSVVLVCDLPKSDDLVDQFFKDFFKIVRYDLSKKIEIFMVDILVAIVDECQSIPPGVLTTLLAQFMDKNLGMEQPAYRLAIQVCNATATKLQRNVCQYFTDIILQHSEDEDFDEIRKAHDLIKRLNRSCPSLLHNVVPQLEEELRVEEAQIRLMATQVLGEMFADKGGADFMKKYPTTWNLWLSRRNDKAASIRLAFVEVSKGLLSCPGEMRDAIEESFQSKLLDPDEKIRAAVCKVYSNLDYEMALHHVSESQWRALCGRGLDKKHAVRAEALNCIGKTYSLAYSELENSDPAAIKQFSWIPQSILNIHGTAPEARHVAEQVLADYIFPLPSSNSTSKSIEVDEVAWTERLLLTMKFLDEKSVLAILNLSSLKGPRPSIYERFVDSCQANNAGVIDENEDAITQRLANVIKRLAGQFPDTQKATEDLFVFAKLNEGRLYSLLKTCMDTQTDLKCLTKATTDFLRRVDQASPGITSTMTIFLRRASLRIVNQSSIPTLIKNVQKKDPDGDSHGTTQAQLFASNADAILTYICRNGPSLYKPHVTELMKAIADEKNSRLVDVSLHALSSLALWDKSLTPTDKRFTERITRFVLGFGHQRVKFATRLLCCFKNRDELCVDIVNSISDGLPEADSDLRLAHIAALTVFASMAPDALEQKSDIIVSFLINKCLMIPKPQDPNAMDTDIDWADDEDIWPELRAKILSLKLCRNRCLVHASSDNPLEVATPVLKMLITILDQDDPLSARFGSDQKERSRLRLQAAVSLLHLSTVDTFANAIAPHFGLLSITIQDSCYQVRIGFLQKLIGLLSARKLPSRFNVIPFLAVHDPEADVKSTAKAFVTAAHRGMPAQMRVENFELIFVRLLHLLAHHPDFATAPANLSDMASYILFYVDSIASSDNASLLFHLASKVKTVRDAVSDTYSENLYFLSEIAQRIIQARAKSRSWSLVSLPSGKVKLPSDILKPLPNAETASKILKTVYLSEETIVMLDERIKPSKTISEAKEKVRAERKSTRKRKSNATTNGNAKRSRTTARRRKVNESDEDEAESSSDEDEHEDATSGAEQSEPAPEVEEEAEPEKEEKHRRNARTKAKARIKQQAHKSKR